MIKKKIIRAKVKIITKNKMTKKIKKKYNRKKKVIFWYNKKKIKLKKLKMILNYKNN